MSVVTVANTKVASSLFFLSIKFCAEIFQKWRPNWLCCKAVGLLIYEKLQNLFLGVWLLQFKRFYTSLPKSVA